MAEVKYLPVVEEFFSLQGEGYHTGSAAYFVRLAGCNIECCWCDSKHSWDESIYPLVEIDEVIIRARLIGAKSVVVTGGEPLAWDLSYMCEGFDIMRIKTFLETSGVYDVTCKWGWICLSPKKHMPPVDSIYNLACELKVVIGSAADFAWAEQCRERVTDDCKLFLQPEWSRAKIIIPEIVEYVKRNPAWRVSVQAHKYIHIP
ncbi:MAG: 7-carboxy-7-deazaguanine synthase QueE [Bacteroidales bacterium]|jgi:organic radical activating enzyme|nr:7-carboxy-7-deazaguanine synthase QueE [Bacteroidales bacterium]